LIVSQDCELIVILRIIWPNFLLDIWQYGERSGTPKGAKVLTRIPVTNDNLVNGKGGNRRLQCSCSLSRKPYYRARAGPKQFDANQ
jgi:hypothetical protein